jgi:dTDP-glucose 4,6-dehydratase
MQNSDLLSKEKKIYAKAKIYCEKKIINFAKKNFRQCSIARCFAFIGQDLPLNKHFFIGNLLKNIKENKPIILKSSQSKFIFRSYMCALDLVLALSKVLMKSSKKCPVYNVGSEKAYSLYEICKVLSKKYKLKFRYPKQNNKSEIDFYIPSVTKLHSIFKFKDDLKKNFSQTLKQILI